MGQRYGVCTIFKDVAKLHWRFCKYILGVKKQTPTSIVYGELARIPLSVICKEMSIKFWLKFMKTPYSPMYLLYRDLCNTNYWASKLYSINDHLGRKNIRLNYDCNENYLHLFKSRIRVQFIQDWNHTINTSPKLHYYCKFKQFWVWRLR
jgi:hypothetical protein